MMRTAGLCLFLLGCSVEPCQPGQHTGTLGFCEPDPVVAAGGGEGGAASSDDVGGASSGGAAGAPEPVDCQAPSEFGDECADSSECQCDVDYCAVQPGATSGICTKTGCAEDPSICPADWQCLDLSVFDPTLPSICTP